MSDLTYTKIASLLPAYTQRPDTAFSDQIPEFVNFAEARLASDMKQQGFQGVVSSNLPLVATLEKPSFWRETISFNYTNSSGERVPILLRSLEYVRNYWPNPSTTGTPKYYADYNATHFLLGPTPSSALAFELVYYARLQPLSSSNDSNWMTLNTPQALFAACMVEACIFTKDKEDQAMWEDRYQSTIGSVKQENSERMADRNTVFTRP